VARWAGTIAAATPIVSNNAAALPSASGAASDAHADVARLLPNGARQRPIETDSREEQSDQAEARQEECAETGLSKRCIEQLIHRLRIETDRATRRGIDLDVISITCAMLQRSSPNGDRRHRNLQRHFANWPQLLDARALGENGRTRRPLPTDG
jgi:hypothetical protein